MKLIHLFFKYFYKIIDRIYMFVCYSAFNTVGKNVIFHPTNSFFSYETISIGDNVGIGERASFNATISYIVIGSNIAIAPNVTIRGGNHRYDIVGKWITDYKNTDKRKEDDEPVFIEDDCWIGANVTILKGVTVGRGSIIAAGAVVSKSIPPYSIVGGIPARVLKFRWNTIEEILSHEKKLYSYDKRLKKEFLKNNMDLYAKK